MNYRRLYLALVQKAEQENGKPEYFLDRRDGYENHHITPKSWGGNDDPENLVRFTYRQHFTAHHLLARFAGGGMAFAFHAMCFANERSTPTPRQFETARRMAASAQTGKKLSESHREAISKGNMGKTMSPESREKMSKAHTGKKLTPEHIAKMIEHLKTRVRSPLTDEQKKNISDAKKGKKIKPCSDERREKVRQAMIGLVRPKLICEHCGTEASAGNLKRWHGNNCKHKAV